MKLVFSLFEFRCFVWFDSFCKPEFLSWTFWLDLLFRVYPCTLPWLLMCVLFVCDRVPGVRSVLLRVSRFHGSSARQVTLYHIPFIPSFYALDSTLKHCMSRIDNMWVLGSSWWGRNLLPCIQTIGRYFSVMLILPCYARRRGLGLSDYMIVVRLLING